MDYKKLLEAAKTLEVAEEDVKRMQQRLTDWDARFQEESNKHKVTQSFLNRTYSIQKIATEGCETKFQSALSDQED